MLISIHLPKTAGSSFQLALAEKFGAGLLKDYGDRPIHMAQGERNAKALYDCEVNREQSFEGVTCIHGHFLPRKYLPLTEMKSTQVVTWLRDPVERLASNYHHWKRWGDADQGSPLVRRFIDQRWSIEQFCFAVEFQNLYSQFLWGFPLARLDFIGITEFYEEDIAYFSQRFLDASLNVYHSNVNGAVHCGKYIIDAGLRAEIESFHGKDVALYRRALEMRQARIAGDEPQGLHDFASVGG